MSLNHVYNFDMQLASYTATKTNLLSSYVAIAIAWLQSNYNYIGLYGYACSNMHE